jgi:hypothetical protein
VHKQPENSSTGIARRQVCIFLSDIFAQLTLGTDDDQIETTIRARLSCSMTSGSETGDLQQGFASTTAQGAVVEHRLLTDATSTGDPEKVVTMVSPQAEGDPQSTPAKLISPDGIQSRTFNDDHGRTAYHDDACCGLETEDGIIDCQACVNTEYVNFARTLEEAEQALLSRFLAFIDEKGEGGLSYEHYSVGAFHRVDSD